MKELEAEALESLKNLWNASVVILVAWVLFLPAAVDRIEEYNAALQLTAWELLVKLTTSAKGGFRYWGDDNWCLKEAVSKEDLSRDPNPIPKSNDPLLSKVCVQDSQIPGGCSDACSRLVVEWTFWPEPQAFFVYLSTAQIRNQITTVGHAATWTPGRAQADLKVVADSGQLPFNSYVISRVLDNDGKPFLAVHNEEDLEAAENFWGYNNSITLEDRDVKKLSRPLDTAVILHYSGTDDLASIDDKKLRELQQDADFSRGSLTVAGVNLNVGFVYAGLGILMAVIAFLMLGPLLVLRHQLDRVTTSWTLAIRTVERPGLEAMLIVIWIGWAIVPLLTVPIQLVGLTALPSPYRFVEYVNLPLLIFSSVVFLRAAFIVRALRRYSNTPSLTSAEIQIP
jgi:hypothetical protein